MKTYFLFILTSITVFFIPVSAFARCVVCYTNGLSGASITVIVIFFSAFFLFFANKFFGKILDKYYFFLLYLLVFDENSLFLSSTFIHTLVTRK